MPDLLSHRVTVDLAGLPLSAGTYEIGFYDSINMAMVGWFGGPGNPVQAGIRSPVFNPQCDLSTQFTIHAADVASIPEPGTAVLLALDSLRLPAGIVAVSDVLFSGTVRRSR